MKTAVLIGATGLIGGEILHQLINQSLFTEIRILVRRPYTAPDPRVRVLQLDFTDKEAFRKGIQGSHHVFCAVGTTRSKTPDLKEYRKIDVDIPVTAAKLCAEENVISFHLVSSVGASGKSSNFYTRMKGEVEDTVSGFSIPGIIFYRPSLLLGKRKERRTAEKISGGIMKLLTPVIPDKYKPIQASTVAKAMIRDAMSEVKGTKVYHYAEMIQN
jgi:uncharacterized protein YbjT (DUF2867 family)